MPRGVSKKGMHRDLGVITWQEILWTAGAFAAVAAVGGVIALAMGRGLSWRRLLPMERFVPCTWTGAEVLLGYLAYVFIPVITVQFLEQVNFYGWLFAQPIAREREVIWASPLALGLFLGAVAAILWYTSRTRPAHFGLSGARWRQNVMLGWVAFLILTAAAYVVSLAAILLLTSLEHPFKELSRGGLWPVEWGLLAFQAVVIAPVMEEVCFRGLLLGWLKRASFPGILMVAAFTLLNGAWPLVAAASKEEGPIPPLDALLGPLIWAVLLVGVYIVLLVQTWRALRPRWEKIQASLPPREALPADTDPDPGPPPLPPWFVFSTASEPLPRSQVRLMLWGQAMLFAAFHSPVWPTPIPLLVLALGLGWLALRTNSLVAPIVVHMLFNAVASTLLFVTEDWLLIGPVQPAP